LSDTHTALQPTHYDIQGLMLTSVTSS